MRAANSKKLSEEEIQDRLAQYSRRPSTAVRDEVVLQYSSLVESIGRRFVGACEPLEDLTQEGYIGLIASVDKYDAAKGVKFSTYATHFIIGQIKHYLRDKGKIIKEPAWLQELNQRMTRVIESLHQKHGRQPTEREIGEVMQMPERAVRELLTTREVFKVTSLDGDREDSPGARDADKIKDQKIVTFQLPIEDKIVLETALERLKDIEQQVIADHYFRGLNQTEIAKKLGISCNYVSHILRNGTKKLKKILTTEEIRDTQMQRTLVSKRISSGEEAEDTPSVMDPATDLYNRPYFLERLREELSRAYRDRHKVAVVFVDVGMPDSADSLVRMTRADDLMYTAAQSIKASVRKMDVVARFGETTFSVILPHTDTHAGAVASRIAEVIGSVEIESGRKASKLNPCVRIGVARYPRHAQDGDGLLQAAADDLGIPLDELRVDRKADIKKAA